MVASVLSPGPSLARVTRADVDGTMIFAVNRAAHHLKCDWWVFGDNRMYTTYPIDYTPRLASCAETKRRLCLANCLTYEELFPEYRPDAMWMIYTCNAALVIAASQGATTIKLYGCDWDGVQDFDGHLYTFAGEEAELTRTAKRWDNERRMFDSTVAMLAEKGVKVERIIYGNS